MLLGSDLKLGSQSSDEQLFDTANFPLAAFHYSERAYQGISNQVIDFHFIYVVYFQMLTNNDWIPSLSYRNLPYGF